MCKGKKCIKEQEGQKWEKLRERNGNEHEEPEVQKQIQ